MADCKKCGAAKGGSNLPQYSVRSTLKQVDGETAQIYFRSKTSFDYNGTPIRFAPAEVKKVNYVHIYAAIRLNPNAVLFLNPAERADFIEKYPEMRTANI